jgi:hypothetical protein
LPIHRPVRVRQEHRPPIHDDVQAGAARLLLVRFTPRGCGRYVLRIRLQSDHPQADRVTACLAAPIVSLSATSGTGSVHTT